MKCACAASANRVACSCVNNHLKRRLSDGAERSCLSAPSHGWTGDIMQNDPARTSPTFLHSLIPAHDSPSQNFAEALPTEMSVKIFSELDVTSLCSASQTCRLWRDIIEESEQLWRRQCLLVRTICQREVDSDRRDGLSWKVTLVRNYTRSCLKRDWLTGRFSHVRSADELTGRKMMPLDVETWGEILQAELDR